MAYQRIIVSHFENLPSSCLFYLDISRTLYCKDKKKSQVIWVLAISRSIPSLDISQLTTGKRKMLEGTLTDGLLSRDFLFDLFCFVFLVLLQSIIMVGCGIYGPKQTPPGALLKFPGLYDFLIQACHLLCSGETMIPCLNHCANP